MSLITNNNSLYQQFNNQVQIFKTEKNKIKKSSEYISDYIDNNTKKEKKDIDNAIKIYENKVNNILNSDDIKIHKNIINTSKKKITYTFQIAKKFFIQSKNIIDSNNKLTYEQKVLATQKLYKKIIEKLYNPKELAEFQKFFTNIVVVMPKDNNMIGYSPINKLLSYK